MAVNKGGTILRRLYAELTWLFLLFSIKLGIGFFTEIMIIVLVLNFDRYCFGLFRWNNACAAIALHRIHW